MEFLWGFHDVSMIFLSMGFLKGRYESYSYGISIVPMGVLMYFYWIPMGFLLCEIPMGFPCYFSYFYDLSMGFLWDSYGISMLFL